MEVWNRIYSELTTAEKTLLDAAGSVPNSTPGGKAGDALTRVNQYAQWWAQAGASATPDAWEHWFVAEAAYLCAVTQQPQRFPEYNSLRKGAMQAAFESFSLDAATIATLQGQTISVQGIRFYVMDRLIRRPKPIFLSPSIIDAETQWCLNFAWNRTAWNMRRRQVRMMVWSVAFEGATWTESTKTLTLTGGFTDYVHVAGARCRLTENATGALLGDFIVSSRTSADAVVLTTSCSRGAVDLTAGDISGRITSVSFVGLGSGESFDSIASEDWTYDDEAGRGMPLEWNNARGMAGGKAITGSQAGRPVTFRTENRAGTTIWHFAPEPDTDYTVQGEVFVSGPGTPATATETTVFDKFPSEMRPHLRDMVYARCVMNQKDGSDLWTRVVEQIDQLFPNYEDPGTPDTFPTTRDVYRDMGGYLGGSL